MPRRKFGKIFNQNASLFFVRFLFSLLLFVLSFLPKNTFAFGFASKVDYTAFNNPYQVIVADFNKDSHLDLATANYGGGNISILLGNGDGTFRTAVDYTAGNNPSSVVSDDFNNDSNLDIAVADSGNNNFHVLFGNGNGTFGAASDFSLGNTSGYVISGNFKEDIHPDLQLTSTLDGRIWQRYGNSGGTFTVGPQLSAGAYVGNFSKGDFNGDGHTDVVAASTGDEKVVVFLGVGDGTFATGVSYSQSFNVIEVFVGTFNSDAYEDLAVVTGDLDVAILLGNGDGTFGTAVKYAVGGSSYTKSVGIGDFNKDSKSDLVVTNNSNIASVLLGNGDGTFGVATNYITDTNPASVAVGDFNEDSYPDFVTANSGAATVSVFLTAPSALPVGTSAVLQNSTSATVDMVVTGSNFSTFVGSGTTTAGAGDLANITYNSTHPTSAVINNSTTMTLTFAIATGTGKSGGSLTIASDTVQDGSLDHNLLITITDGNIADNAVPQYVSSTTLDNNNDRTADYIKVVYSEPILDSTVSASDFETGIKSTEIPFLVESFSSGAPSSGNATDVADDNTIYVGVASGTETISSSKTDYTLKVLQTDAITDLVGNIAPGSLVTTYTSSDGARPFVVDVTPLDDSTNQSIDSHIVINFTEPVSTEIFDVTNIPAASGVVWSNENKHYDGWHGGDSAFSAGSTYTPTLSASTTKDLNNNFIVSDYSWSFTTAGVGASSAVLQNSTSATVDMVVTGSNFSTFVGSGTTTAGAGDLANITYNSTHPTSAVINNSTTMTLTFAIATGTGKSGGSLTIASDTVQDGSLDHNLLITITDGSIMDNARPVIMSVSPIDGTIEVSTSPDITINFSEPIYCESFADPSGSPNLPIPSHTCAYGIYSASYAGLQSETLYTLTVAATTTRDIASTPNYLATDYIWSFTTRVAELTVPTLTTTSITSITQTNASGGGNISSDGGSSVVARGVVWDTSVNPTTTLSTKTSNGTGTGSFASSITNLTANTLYHVRAYATNSTGTGYGADTTFTTLGNSVNITITAADELGNSMRGITATAVCSGGTQVSGTDVAGIVTLLASDISTTGNCSNGNAVTITVAKDGYVTSSATQTYDTGTSPNIKAFTGIKYAQKIAVITEGTTSALAGATVTAGSSHTTCVESSGIYYCPIIISEDGGTGDISIVKDGYVTNTSFETVNRTASADAQGTISATGVVYAQKVAVVDSNSAALSGANVSGGNNSTSCAEGSIAGIYYCPILLSDTGTSVSASKSGYGSGSGSFTHRSSAADPQSTTSISLTRVQRTGGSGAPIPPGAMAGPGAAVTPKVIIPAETPHIIDGCDTNDGFSAKTGEPCANAIIKGKTSTAVSNISSPFTRAVVYWEKSKEVIKVQNFLKDQGYFTDTVTGIYGPNTYTAIRKFQIANDINATGAVGPLTLSKMNELYQSNSTTLSQAEKITTVGSSSGIKISKGVDISTMKTSGPFTKVIVYWEKSQDVKDIQNFLKEQGYFTDMVTGIYGPSTYNALRKFQIANNIRVTGAVGPLTLDRMNELSINTN